MSQTDDSNTIEEEAGIENEKWRFAAFLLVIGIALLILVLVVTIQQIIGAGQPTSALPILILGLIGKPMNKRDIVIAIIVTIVAIVLGFRPF